MRVHRGRSSSTAGSALWRGSRLLLFVLLGSVAIALAAPAVARADASVPPGLAKQAAANPDAIFKVIVQGSRGRSSAAVARAVANARGRGRGVTRRFLSINGVAAELSGRQVLNLARGRGIVSITPDDPVVLAGAGLTNWQRWPYATGVSRFWSQIGQNGSGPQAPTIALVDSGVDASRADFGGRVVKQVDLTSLSDNSPGDGRGHGTFVASIAAGSADHHAGAAPNAKLVSLDVINDQGMGLTSDVIAAADWILQNKDQYGIRVANFSLLGSVHSTFRFDPLDKAVEKLWFSGVAVVAAAGNYADHESGVLYAPGNDPFVITVGAQDISGSVSTNNDFPAPWSSYGYTLDGFAKPEISAPGRMMIGAVPPDSTLALERPDRMVEPGYLMMSGTSFSTAIVSGAAADILAVHPNWTPDQVKGALMLTARPIELGPPLASGVGEVDADAAAAVSDPPNPNLALNQFLVADPGGGSLPVFDQATWTTNALADPNWDAATWTTATWTTATWTTATWTTATWTTAAWDAATWTTATWTTATWTTATWTTATWTTATWTTSNDAD